MTRFQKKNQVGVKYSTFLADTPFKETEGVHALQWKIMPYTPPTAPEKWCLEDEFPFRIAYF